MVSTRTVFVHEYVTGGGWPAAELPRSLAAEAMAMLWALLADFRAWGQLRTVTTLDTRLVKSLAEFSPITLPADEVVHISPGRYEAIFSSLVACNDAAIIIAPETEGVLTRLSAMVVSAGIPLLSSRPAATAIAGDKAACYQRFRQAGLPTPLTFPATFATASQIADEIGYPLVIKPVDGVGCEGVCLVTRPAELADALVVLRQATRLSEILLQSFVGGTHASVSLLVAGGRALPLSLNRQEIETGCPFTYRGGIVPLSHPAAGRAFDVALGAVNLVSGLQGYVGVDLILTAEEAWLIEINPRLTTSYLGLRKVLDCNLAQAIWNACRRGILPANVSLSGQATFTKGDPAVWHTSLACARLRTAKEAL
jgi:tyramine---L-glutamate ligase